MLIADTRSTPSRSLTVISNAPLGESAATSVFVESCAVTRQLEKSFIVPPLSRKEVANWVMNKVVNFSLSTLVGRAEYAAPMLLPNEVKVAQSIFVATAVVF